MPLTLIDWIVIAGYLLINLAIGIYYRRRAGGNTEEFFISGRNVSWWLAGTSMVATTFAADTPLFVSGVIATQGIAGNWIWWTSCLGGMLTVSFLRDTGGVLKSSPTSNSLRFAMAASRRRFCAASRQSILGWR